MNKPIPIKDLPQRLKLQRETGDTKAYFCINLLERIHQKYAEVLRKAVKSLDDLEEKSELRVNHAIYRRYY